MGEDKRREPRVSVTTEVWIGIHGMWVHTAEQVRDLSVGGAFVVPFDGLRPGGLLDVKFKLPGDDREILCSAIVRHTGGGDGIGIQFLDLQPAEKSRIEAFVGAHDPREGAADD